MQTPVLMDAFSRIMAGLYDEQMAIQAPTGFQSLFGMPGSETIFSDSAEVVDVEIVKGDRKITAGIHRGTVGHTMSPSTITTANRWSPQSRVFPLIPDQSVIRASDVNKRQPGEQVYLQAGLSERQARRMALSARLARHMMSKVVHTFEYLAAQSFINGTMPVVFDASGAYESYDFQRSAGNNLTAATVWTDAASDPLSDIDDMLSAIQTNGNGLNGSIAGILMSEDAYRAFINHADVQKLADTREFNVLSISMEPEITPIFGRITRHGLVPRGRLQANGGWVVYIFTYNKFYTDLNETNQSYMPSGTAVAWDPSIRMDRYFGPGEFNEMTASRMTWFEEMFGFSPEVMSGGGDVYTNADMVVTPEMFHWNAFSDQGEKGLTLEVQAAPIYATTAADRIAKLDGVTV
ncbi:hypothetical protein GWN42_31410 [candidate division KSB1 bacterium]|nr:hypothetical protein [Phycisphaerae bacterium]NIQ92568.1 hypothetical protein [Deltaproteobacteria bacterium]NIV97178.1 hypothetical protein [candidate division KSB1 bacterium]